MSSHSARGARPSLRISQTLLRTDLALKNFRLPVIYLGLCSGAKVIESTLEKVSLSPTLPAPLMLKRLKLLTTDTRIFCHLDIVSMTFCPSATLTTFICGVFSSKCIYLRSFVFFRAPPPPLPLHPVH